MSTTSVPPRLHCGSLRSSHDMHYLQMIRVAPRHPPLAIEDIDAPGDGVVRLRIDGAMQRLHKHAPHEVIAAWEARTGVATWIPGAVLLQIPHAGGTACFSVSWTSPGPCPDAREAQEQMNALFKEIIDQAIADGALGKDGGEAGFGA
jgi:hypothetical protein